MTIRSNAGMNPLYEVLKRHTHTYEPQRVAALLSQLNESRVLTLAHLLSSYISVNLEKAIGKRNNLADYRTNPYVLLTTASVMKLTDPRRFADFLFNNKLYMGLETSFGKSIEAAFVGQYPVVSSPDQRWIDAPEKVAENTALRGLSREEKARHRNNSVWREIDKSCVVGTRRYLVSIKSGPACINDTQVEGMKSAIARHYATWMHQTQATYSGVTELDIVIGITYGTDRTSNNKENQILTKLLDHGFVEEDRVKYPGVLIDSATQAVRVYRCIGQDFWAFIGDPTNPATAKFVFLEVLLALSRALTNVASSPSLEDGINRKLLQLSTALQGMMFPRGSLPEWIRKDFSEDELFWLETAMSVFFDNGF